MTARAIPLASVGIRIRAIPLEHVIAAALPMLAFAFYWIAGNQYTWDGYPMLADAFLQGRLKIVGVPGMELVPLADGWAYVPFPPVPALTYIPFVAIGVELLSSTACAVAGALNVALVYWLLRRMDVAHRSNLWITAGFAFSTAGWVAGEAGMWLYAQTLAVTFGLLALHLALRGRWPLVAGILLGLAAGSRLPAGLALPLLVYLYRRSNRQLVALLAGVALVALPIAAYNVARFGSPLDFGYDRIISLFNGPQTVLSEPWFADGILSWTYIPRSLGAMLLQGFVISSDAPYLQPQISGLSIAISAPIYLLALRAPRVRLAAVLWITVVAVMLPNWAHGSWGFWQYGYRFIVDASPALVMLLGLAYLRRSPDAWLRAAVLLGTAATAYGFFADHVLHFTA